MASYCAEDQGMYWEYHDLLYNSQESIDGGWANSERLKAFAFSLGLDLELFDSCLDSEKYSKRVQYNIQQARDHGVRGTPGFFIVGPDGQQKISGAQPFSVFKTNHGFYDLNDTNNQICIFKSQICCFSIYKFCTFNVDWFVDFI